MEVIIGRYRTSPSIDRKTRYPEAKMTGYPPKDEPRLGVRTARSTKHLVGPYRKLTD
jgi:hypothetical protein